MNLGTELDTLMARYQAGDRAAITALVQRVGPRLHRLFTAQSASRRDADDLLQETWLRIHRVRHTYRPGAPVLPWVYAIAHRVRIDHYRQVSRTSSREYPLHEDSMPSSLAVAHDESRDDDLETLLAPLSEKQREILRMLKVAGMSLEEVSLATSCSIGSIKQKVHRAYRKLREGMNTMRPRPRSSGNLP
jgi:RNA polymerase sigma-70 factor, ECF subfamily